MAKNSKKEKEATKMESKSVYVRGILTDAFYGKRSFKKGEDAKDKYRFSIKANADDMAALVEAAGPYYEDTDEKWIPKWFTDEDAREYLNLSSNFDIKAGMKNPETGKIDDIGYLTDYISDNGNINGSKVVIMIVLKEGAIYPVSILIKEIHKVTMAEMFAGFTDSDDDDDELPFC